MLITPVITAQSIAPAHTIAPTKTAANVPLLPVETLQFTDAVLERIAKGNATAQLANVFAFDSNSTTPGRNFTACKTFPGDAFWPSASNWETFNALLNSGLVPTVPIGAPCYNSQWGQKDIARCNAIVSAFTRPLTQYVVQNSRYSKRRDLDADYVCVQRGRSNFDNVAYIPGQNVHGA